MTPEKPQQVAVPQLPEKTPTPPVFGNMPSKKPAGKSPTATFLGSDAVANPANTGEKKLVGN